MNMGDFFKEIKGIRFKPEYGPVGNPIKRGAFEKAQKTTKKRFVMMKRQKKMFWEFLKI